jgi:hypothetical protein
VSEGLLDEWQIFSSDRCASRHEDPQPPDFGRTFLCRHERRSDDYCSLLGCPRLDEHERARQLLIRRQLEVTPPRFPSSVLFCGESNEGHGDDEVWAWIDGAWRQRIATAEELQRISFGYFVPGREVFAGWIVDLFAAEAPDVLRQLGALQLQQARPIPADLAQGIRHINSELLRHLRRDPSALEDMNPYAFEELIAELLAGRGWRVSLVANKSSVGADLLATTRTIGDGQEILYLIEVKKTAERVGIEVLDRVFGAMSRLRPEPHVGMVVSLSGFKALRDPQPWRVEGREYGRIRLAGRKDILQWLNEYSPSPEGGLWLPSRWLHER